MALKSSPANQYNTSSWYQEKQDSFCKICYHFTLIHFLSPVIPSEIKVIPLKISSFSWFWNASAHDHWLYSWNLRSSFGWLEADTYQWRVVGNDPKHCLSLLGAGSWSEIFQLDFHAFYYTRGNVEFQLFAEIINFHCLIPLFDVHIGQNFIVYSLTISPISSLLWYFCYFLHFQFLFLEQGFSKMSFSCLHRICQVWQLRLGNTIWSKKIYSWNLSAVVGFSCTFCQFKNL